MYAQTVFLTMIAGALTFSAPVFAQGYAFVECREGETPEECKERREREREEAEQKAREEREDRADEAREEREDRADEAREESEDRADDSSSSSSSSDDLLRPSTSPMFFVGAIGPTFFGLNRGRGGGFGGRGRGAGAARGKLALDFGYHFSGDGEGPAIGATIEQTFDDSFYVLNPGFKFWWDIMPIDDMGLYIAPFAKAGYALVAACPGNIGCPGNAFNLAVGAEGRLVLDDSWMVLVRPLQVDTYLGDVFNETFWLNYSVLIGGGLTF